MRREEEQNKYLLENSRAGTQGDYFRQPPIYLFLASGGGPAATYWGWLEGSHH